MLPSMPASVSSVIPALNLHLAKARAKLLAREDRKMKSELIALRQRAGLTQANVADMLGISQQAVNKLERYDSDPKLSTLRRYANAVGALVEHHVVPDLGQSEWAASSTRWESISEMPRTAVLAPTPLHAGISTGWTGSSLIEFDLVG
jgi:DNA-binding XRE family transcriptional regulator